LLAIYINLARMQPDGPLTNLFDYVEGAFPSGMKFQNELGDKQVRQIQQSGGKVIVLPPDLQIVRFWKMLDRSAKRFKKTINYRFGGLSAINLGVL